MNAFHRRQSVLIMGVILSLVAAMAASALLRGLLLPVFVPAPFYLHPTYIALILLFGLFGLFTVFRADDRGWPLFAGLVGLFIVLIGFEDSILQWFLFQLGIGTIGGRVNPLAIGASLAAMGFAILIHVGQLGRRLRFGFQDRGLDPRELRLIEEHVHAMGRRLVLNMVGLAVAGAFILWIAEFVLSQTSIGIGALGILGGLLIVSIIAVMAYRVLRTGPAGTIGEADVERIEARPRDRRPPRGLR